MARPKGIPSSRKGKTNVEIYGTEKAEELRIKNSNGHKGIPNSRKGKSDVEFFGEERAKELSQRFSGIWTEWHRTHEHPKGMKGKIPHNKGKTNIELYGEEKAKDIYEKLSIARKGIPSWNAGTAGMSIMKPNITSFKKGEHRSPSTEFKPGHITIIDENFHMKRPEYRENQRQNALRQKPIFKNTNPELCAQYALTQLNITFEPEKAIVGTSRCDLWFAPNVVGYIHGCFWHGCPICFPDKTKLKRIQLKQIAHDAEMFSKLEAKGIWYFIIWEHELKPYYKEFGIKRKRVIK
jgi:G:T-mismatch repair DNA endonuclease (very short patch repair protein)